MKPPILHPYFLLVPLAVGLLAFGCSRKQPIPPKTDISREALVLALEDIQVLFDGSIRDASNLIQERSQTSEERRLALLWRSEATSRFRSALDLEQPVQSLLDTWAYLHRMNLYLTTGDGRSLFGENQSVSIEAIQGIEAQVEHLAQEAFGEKNKLRIQENIHAFAVRNPMTGTTASAPSSPRFTLGRTGGEMLSFVTSIPMAPVKVVSGFGEGAGSIKDISVTADRFTGVVESFPEQARLQMEILLLELENNDLLTSTILSFQRVADTTAEIVRVSEDLPKRVGDETRSVLKAAESNQAALHALVLDTRKTIEDTEVALKAANLTLQEAAGAASAWEATANAVAGATREINTLAYPPNAKPPSPDSHPFDIRDYTRAAEAITSGGYELRLLVQDLNQLIERSDRLATLVDRTGYETQRSLDTASGHMERLVDQIAWRAAQLLILAVLLVFLYKAISNRLSRPRP